MRHGDAVLVLILERLSHQDTSHRFLVNATDSRRRTLDLVRLGSPSGEFESLPD